MRSALPTVLLVAALAGCGGGGEPEDRLADGPAPGSTLERTLVDADGDGFLEPGPGLPLRDRGKSTLGQTTKTLATLVQITDAHVTDEESPARVPFLDRYGGAFATASRPHEALSAQILDKAVAATNTIGPDAVLVTGDLVDSAQRNELALARAVLDGQRARPDSGTPGYAGVQLADGADPFYYRPDVDAPRHPGLLARAQRAFDAEGLNAPWYPVAGNHDVLVQGTVARTPETEYAAVGQTLLATPPPDLPDRLEGVDPESADFGALLAAARAEGGRSIAVAPDRGRSELTPTEATRALSDRTGDDGRLDYGFDVGEHLRVVILDINRRDRGSDGLVVPETVAFLERELAREHDRSILVVSHQPLVEAQGSAPALAAIDADPRVVALLNGHRHRNSVRPRRGYWVIETAALIDFPQQLRALRLVRTASGRLALETFMVDHAGRPGDLAGIGRELAFLDAQGGRPANAQGRVEDRNVRLEVQR